MVLDSFSTDRTVEIARAAGARVFQRAFDDFAGQRNHALDHVEFRHPWVFHLDADERFTDSLRAECEQVIGEDRHSGFLVPSKLMFEGRWLRHAGMYPTFQMRLLKVGEVRFVQHGHGQREAEAARALGTLTEPYLHFNFSKGMSDWWQKHEQYAAQEAAEIWRAREDSMPIRELFASDAVTSRRAMKRATGRLPGRSIARFVYMYLLRRGFLDGAPGYRYCRMLAGYEGMIAQNLKRLRRQEA